MSAGEDFSCGITTSGTAMCWGSDSDGQLGNGGAPSSSTPVPVLSDLKWVQISTGRKTACGVTTAGRGFCWGYNNHGEVGDGTTISRSAPVKLGDTGGSGPYPPFGGLWAWIVASENRTCGINSRGEGFCWGYDAKTGHSTLHPSFLTPEYQWSAYPRQSE